jgi:hypothetical protein
MQAGLQQAGLLGRTGAAPSQQGLHLLEEKPKKRNADPRGSPVSLELRPIAAPTSVLGGVVRLFVGKAAGPPPPPPFLGSALVPLLTNHTGRCVATCRNLTIGPQPFVDSSPDPRDAPLGRPRRRPWPIGTAAGGPAVPR